MLFGVCVVIDSGQVCELCYDFNSGFIWLDVVVIVQVLVDQCVGCVGCVVEGMVWWLWLQLQWLELQCCVEIDQVELVGLVLELVVWGSSDLCFFDLLFVGLMGVVCELLQWLGVLFSSGVIIVFGCCVLVLGMYLWMVVMLLVVFDVCVQVFVVDLVVLLEVCDLLCQGGDVLVVCWCVLVVFCNGCVLVDVNCSGLVVIDIVVKQW